MKLGEKLTEGSVFKKYVFFIVPILLSGFIQQLYNTADAMVVGKFAGDTALAAVGSTASLTNLILNLFLGLATGANVVCSQYYGANDKKSLERTIHTAICLACLSGVLLAMIGILFSKSFLRMMSTPDSIIDHAALYMQIYFAGAPASLLYNFGAAVLRAAGDTKRPLCILMLAGLVNIGLNLFCVIVLKMGVAGVALGTIVSQILSAIGVTAILLKTDSEFKLRPSRLKIYMSELKKIARVGIPSGLNGVIYSISNVTIQSTLNLFGKVVVAGNTASINIETFGFLIMSAAEQAVVSFVGQNMGARKYDRVASVTRTALLTCFISSLLFSVVSIRFADALLGLFTDAASRNIVIGAGMLRLTIVMSSYVLQVPGQVLNGALKGMGRATLPTVINTVCVCLLRVVWVIAVFPLNPTLNMLYYSYPISWALSSASVVVAYIIIRKKAFKGGALAA